MTDTPDYDDDMLLVTVAGQDGARPRRTLSFSRAPTVLMTFAANRYTRTVSRIYQDRFGIGAMDWRMLVMLTREPGSSVSHASRIIGIDKAAVSRSLTQLEKRGLVRAETPGPDGRRRLFRLTEPGHAMHDALLELALEQNRHLFAGFSAADITTLAGLLSRFLTNLDASEET
ncbi:MAG: DNA-binding MarR family transcriptional regulator [Paracoccaceae bacterium]|jgi:DNA-binding MarR family transcriptional regulator